MSTLLASSHHWGHWAFPVSNQPSVVGRGKDSIANPRWRAREEQQMGKIFCLSSRINHAGHLLALCQQIHGGATSFVMAKIDG